MGGNFHESYTRGEITPPNERSTGLTLAVVAAIISVVWRNNLIVLSVALSMGAAFAAISLTAPRLLKPLNILWFQFGLLLHRIVNPIILFCIFAIVFVPAGLIMRIWHDPLRSRRASAISGYWIDRDGSDQKSRSMTNQF